MSLESTFFGVLNVVVAPGTGISHKSGKNARFQALYQRTFLPIQGGLAKSGNLANSHRFGTPVTSAASKALSQIDPDLFFGLASEIAYPCVAITDSRLPRINLETHNFETKRREVMQDALRMSFGRIGYARSSGHWPRVNAMGQSFESAVMSYLKARSLSPATGVEYRSKLDDRSWRQKA